MNTITKSWKTSLAGIFTLALAGIAIYSDPAKVNDHGVQATIAGGIGLLLAGDHTPELKPAEAKKEETEK